MILKHSSYRLVECIDSMCASYCLRWHEPTSSGGDSWFLRGIREDGSFWGEVQRIAGDLREQRNIEGRLSAVDYRRLLQLIQNIRDSREVHTEPRVAKGKSGVLAEGSVQHPTVIIRYSHGDEATSVVVGHFLAIVDVLRPYIQAEW